jgi:hypothetical protein
MESDEEHVQASPKRDPGENRRAIDRDEKGETENHKTFLITFLKNIEGSVIRIEKTW